jgi:hypothetical protein
MGALTFLMGRDVGSANAFYAEAKGFFTPTSEVIEAPAGGQTLEAVFKMLRDRAASNPATIYNPINLVSHATGFSSLEFRLRAGGPEITTQDEITAEILSFKAATKPWKQLGFPIITPDTNVVLYGCDVGRDAKFIGDLGQLFADALHIYAPLRVAVFRHSGTPPKYEHRLARTWAVPWPDNIGGSKTPAKWKEARDKFVDDAKAKFGLKWLEVHQNDDPLGMGLETLLKSVAKDADASMKASWFFGETVGFTGDDISLVKPPPSAVLPPGGRDVDDTTVANVVRQSDFKQVNATNWIAYTAVLAQIIEEEVAVTDTKKYRHVKIAAQQAPSPGPKPPAGAPPVSAPAHSSLWDEARDELIAAGMDADVIDEFVAGAAPGKLGELALADPGLPSPEGTDGELSPKDFA